jgi:hypothetical protein
MGKIRGDRRRTRVLVATLTLIVLSAVVPAAPATSSATPPLGSAPAAAAGLDAAPTGGFHPLPPNRIADSRKGLGIAGPVGARETVGLDVVGVGGVPDSGVAGVAVNVTLIGSEATHLTLWPAGGTRPQASTVNNVVGSPVANLAFVEPGAGGLVSVFNNAGEATVIVDVVGWFDAGAGGGRMRTLTGERLLDTRKTTGAVGPGGAVEVDVTGAGGVPDAGVSAVMLNVVAVDPTALTHLTVWPAGSPVPTSSTLNTVAGATVANLAVVSPGTDGKVRIRNNSGSSHVVVDVVGWVDSGEGGGGGFVPLAPSRLYDSRTPASNPLTSGEQRELDALGGVGLPADGVAGIVVNVTTIGHGDASSAPAGSSHLTMSTPGSARPPVSTVNTPEGWTIARLTIVSPGTAGRIAAYSSSGHEAVVVDVVGYVEAGVDLDETTKLAADRCDMLAPTVCMLPFPSDRYTVADPSTGTGRRVAFHPESVPANKDGVPVDPAIFEGNDGFSPGAAMLLHLPQVDLAASGAPPLTDVASSLDPDSPIVLLDATTGGRHPFWAELDSQADDPANRNLVVHPATNLLEGHRYVIAMRGLVATGGAPIEPTDAFRALRDGLVSDSPHLEARRQHYERLFADLAGAGVGPDDLLIAWDFTVASAEGLAGRMLHIRDDALAELGGDSPSFVVDTVENDVDASVARRITGRFSLPNYLTGAGGPGETFVYGPDGLPVQNGVHEATFQCNVPHSVLGEGDAVTPARPVVYGHGLLGSKDEVNASNIDAMTNEHDMVYCATDWIGMSENDVLVALGILQDMSKFPQLADRVQQGILNTIFLGRLMIHADGFVSDPAFQGAGGAPVLDRTELFYDGNSQGGIIGGAATAVSVDWTRAVLGVPGMNYGTLLARSVDFNQFLPFFEASYTDEVERVLVLQMAQLLWDRAETNGYAQHLTDDPYPATPAHDVLMHVAFADHQVSMTTAEIEARTIGARIHQPALADGRHHDPVPYWGIEAIPSYPYDGSAIVIWDSGTPTPPTANIPPTAGSDPHEYPRRSPDARQQKSEFLKPGGTVIDVCSAAPCLAPPA